MRLEISVGGLDTRLDPEALLALLNQIILLIHKTIIE